MGQFLRLIESSNTLSAAGRLSAWHSARQVNKKVCKFKPTRQNSHLLVESMSGPSQETARCSKRVADDRNSAIEPYAGAEELSAGTLCAPLLTAEQTRLLC